MAGELNPALILLETCSVVLDFIFGIVLLWKTIKIGKVALRNYYLCVTGFFFAHGTFVLTHVIYLFNNIGSLFDFGVLLVLSSLVLLVAGIEFTLFKQSKRFFTIFGCISIVIIGVDIFTRISIFGMRLMVLVQYFVNPLLVLFIVLIYLNAARKARGSTRRNALLVFFAIVMFMIAELARSQVANQLFPGVDLIGAVLMVISIVMLYYGILHLSVWKRETQPSQPKETRNISES